MQLIILFCKFVVIAVIKARIIFVMDLLLLYYYLLLFASRDCQTICVQVMADVLR